MENRYEHIPDEMKALQRFVGWRKEDLNGKIAKLPFSLIDGQASDWNKPSRWINFDEAIEKNTPLGFVLTDEDKLVCVDLDHAIQDSKLTEMAREVADIFQGTYMELSQSGQGIHIFMKGSIPKNLNLSSKGIEFYKDNRYIALTGNVGNGMFFDKSNQLLEKQEELDRLYEKWAQDKSSIQRQIRDYHYEPLNYDSRLEKLSLDEILATMERTNRKASQLLSGASITGDHSRDDFIFLVLARNYTNGNPKMMKDLFLMTPLNRLGTKEKRKDDQKYIEYLENSIARVLKLGNFRAFDWSKHFAYKERMKVYERV